MSEMPSPSRGEGASTTTTLAALLPPLASRLPRGDIEAIVEVGRSDPEHERRKRLLVVVFGGLIPDRVRHWVRAIGEARDRFAQRECGAFRVIEIRHLAPGRNTEQPLVGFAGFPGVLHAAIDAEAAAVDLARAQMNESQRLR